MKPSADPRALAATAGVAVLAVGALAAGIVVGGSEGLPGGIVAPAEQAAPVQDAARLPPAAAFALPPPDSVGVTTGIVEAGRASLGEPAPDFDLETPDGGRIKLADVEGKPVILNFWATWCRPCAVEMPYLQTAHMQHADKGLVVIGVNVGEQTSVVQPWLEERSLTFPIALDLNGRVADTYRVYSYPTTYLIDRDGRVINVRRGMFANQFDIDQSVGLILPEVKAP